MLLISRNNEKKHNSLNQHAPTLNKLLRWQTFLVLNFQLCWWFAFEFSLNLFKIFVLCSSDDEQKHVFFSFRDEIRLRAFREDERKLNEKPMKRATRFDKLYLKTKHASKQVVWESFSFATANRLLEKKRRKILEKKL